MTGLYKRKRDVALIATVNNINYLKMKMKWKPNEKTFVQRGRDDKPHCVENRHRDEESDMSQTKTFTNLTGIF